MNIYKLEVAGFKLYEQSQLFTFGMVNRIEGGRDQGKTTLSEAIVWCIKGCSLTGDSRGIIKQLKNEASKELRVTSYWKFGSANGEVLNHKICRISKGRSSTLYLDDNKVVQGIVDALFGSTDMFLSAFIPGYISGLSGPRLRDLIVSLLPQASHEAVLHSFTASEQAILNKLSETNPISCLLEHQNELKEWDGYILEVKNKINLLKFQVTLQEKSSTSEEAKRLLALKKEFQDVSEEKKPELRDYVVEMLEEQRKLGIQYRRLESEWKQLKASSLPNVERLQLEIHQRQLDLDSIATKCRQILQEGYNLRDCILHEQQLYEQDLKEFADLQNHRLQSISEEISRLEAKQSIHSDKQVNQKTLTHLSEQLEEALMEREQLQEQIDLIRRYAVHFAEIQLEMANGLLSNANIILTKRIVDQQINFYYKLSYKGQSLHSLTSIEKAYLSSDISSLIHNVHQKRFPIFVDIGESVHVADLIKTQYFETHFVPQSSLKHVVISA
ncbi:hypothetical protein ABE82_26420 (plasmid) [Paenibacillus peoriae]|uniref:hypothetical protein n=1 Tax=Paenibacillus peoriae TaxID=59893 RepID=UPI0007217411|nr:hypothetical protein [Paenibacillus peoriae]ALS09952.1 hypothetical protein ABE82_26420 [Paenibacillus peoriae]